MALALTCASGCGESAAPAIDAGGRIDQGRIDAGVPNDVDAGDSDASAPDAGAPDSSAPDAGAPGDGSQPKILSAYHGLDALPLQAAIGCGPSVVGEDGMPVVFSVRLDPDSVTAAAFAVEVESGEIVTPVCATLVPAVEPLERRTVLLAGPFGTPTSHPRAVEVVGTLRDEAGATVTRLRTESIVPLASGPSVVLAERFAPDTPGLVDECPTETLQVVQLTWNGGVTGPDSAALDTAQREGVSILLESGARVTPIALADDDPDNHVHACLDDASPAQSVTVAAGLFHDPGDDANPETSASVILGVE